MDSVIVSKRGAQRWAAGHPWIYRSDVQDEAADAQPSLVSVMDQRGRFLGRALYSPASEIRLRLLSREDVPIDRAWWAARIVESRDRRPAIDATAYRIVHAEADGLPSLIVDRYGPYLAAQFLSAGLETCRDDIIAALLEVLEPSGILLRNDAPIRRHEKLPATVEVAFGEVPEEIEVEEHGVRYRAALRTGQKSGAFLDQRENRALAGSLAQGRALDVFAYEGGFALNLARRANEVIAVESSAEAIARGRANAELNGLTNITWLEANAFDVLREYDREGQRFDFIVLDPPAFAKARDRIDNALAGYKEINLRAMKLLAPGGRLLTCSCSYHVGREPFLAMLADAAGDSGRRVRLESLLGQPADHPEILAIPETGYLKGALLSA
jgi:23S rRNA (cytosine1962-C5)-methyltransferase